eukprot:TRINITY_DN4724_c0_g1_i1.p2 TRINITY_DN4724_c0_g1~~TRINITY_DN4724_c0_g1_i1.p2  ORF type:complete len:254 (-),score=26.75 TRINITY_DN4724_c0_g1_i1:373-1134(-)
MASAVNGKEEEVITMEDAERLLKKGEILQSSELLEYVLKTSAYPRETPEMRELRELSESLSWGVMTLAADEAQFLMMLVKLMNAKKTMEIGVFTGYSLLCTAIALPADGKIIAIDIDKEPYEKGKPIIEKAGVAQKIDFRHGDAMQVLEDLINNKEVEEGSLDFVLVDADKRKYLDYHEKLLKLVRVGGVVAYDNTLWCGSVANPAHPALKVKPIAEMRDGVLKLNNALAADTRIEISQISIGDGLTLCRKIA